MGGFYSELLKAGALMVQPYPRAQTLMLIAMFGLITLCSVLSESTKRLAAMSDTSLTEKAAILASYLTG